MFDYHILFATYEVSTSPLLESQDARRFVGLSVAAYDALDGGHYWLDDYDTRTFRCKADVIAYYRASLRKDVVLQELQQRTQQKQAELSKAKR